MNVFQSFKSTSCEILEALKSTRLCLGLFFYSEIIIEKYFRRRCVYLLVYLYSRKARMTVLESRIVPISYMLSLI